MYEQAGPPPILGDPIAVTIKRTAFALTEEQIFNWLRLYGTIESVIIHKFHQELPTVKDDHMEIVMKLRRHIPSTLPAHGKKVLIQYKGQKIQCSKCYAFGHTRRYCTSNTVNWLGFIKKLKEEENVPDSYFGVWLEYLRAHEAVVASEF